MSVNALALCGDYLSKGEFLPRVISRRKLSER